jgi:hypothetical protein
VSGIDSKINSPEGSVETNSCHSGDDLIETPKVDESDKLKNILSSGQNIVKVNEILKKQYDMRELV